MPKLEIDINPRLHLGLISMHSAGPRRNGGIGFAIDQPSASISIEISDEFDLVDLRDGGLGRNERETLLRTLGNVRSNLGLRHAISTTISGGLLTHHGMGSGTAVRLACIEGMLVLNGRGYSSSELVDLSGRGGASGVGISTYFYGGMTFDLGVRHTSDDGFLPSSQSARFARPLELCNRPFPEWKLGLCLPRKCVPKTQQEEVEFFSSRTPLSPESSFEAAYIAVFGLLAAAMEADYVAFCQAVDRMQNAEWKRLEREQYGRPLEDADRALRDLGADCVGMSSLGPMLFFFGSGESLRRAKLKADDIDAEIILASPQNTGRLMRTS